MPPTSHFRRPRAVPRGHDSATTGGPRPPFRRAAAGRRSLRDWSLRRRWRQLAATGLCLLATALLARERASGVTSVRLTAPLPAGHVLTAGDLEAVRVPAALLPEHAIADPEQVVGRELLSPAASGELLTATRLDRPRPGGADSRVVSLPIADAGTLSLISAGSIVDVLSAGHEVPLQGPQGALPQAPSSPSNVGPAPRIIVESATVVDVPRDKRGEPVGTVAVAVNREAAASLASAALSMPLALSILR